MVAATFALSPADPDTIKARLDDIRRWRQAHQPIGLPSAGSVFRNPAGDSAGRLIEAAGLKGLRIGGAVVSAKHANFIVNDQKGTASDVRRLAEHVRAEILARHGLELAFEIEFVGDWSGWEASRVTSSSRPPVVVLLGGPSAEHDVSVVSGTAVAEALSETGHDVEQVLIDLEGRWWWLPADHRRADRPAAAYDDPAGLGADGPIAAGAALDRLASLDPPPVVFIALHGPFGEDGTVQAMLEAAGLAYTGSGVAASALGMDKALFKRMSRGIGLPVAEWREVRAARWAAARDAVLTELAAFADGTGDARLMIKPSGLGSSVGMTLAHTPDERAEALDLAFRFDDVALVEAYVAGARDLEVSIIGNDHGRLEVFGPGEVVSGHEFYDYAAKYTPGLSESSTRAEVPEATRQVLHKIARDTYRAIGAEGFARVDFLLAGDAVYLSEINTIPGFTPISLFPTMPAEGGYTFAAVCDRIVDLAVERHAVASRPSAHDRGPAAMNGRPLARRTRTPVHTRRTRPVRRASAGLSTVRAGAALAMLVSAAAIYGVGASPAFDYTKMQLEGVQFTDPAAVEARPRRGSWREPVPAVDRAPAGGARAAAHRRPRPDRRPAAGDPGGHHRGAGADPRLAGGRRTLPGRGRRHPVREARRRRRPAALRRVCPRSTTAGPVRAPSPSGRGSARSTSMRRPGWPRSGRPTSGARRSRWPSR